MADKKIANDINIRLGVSCPHCGNFEDDALDEITTAADLEGAYHRLECEHCEREFEFSVSVEVSSISSATEPPAPTSERVEP